MRFESPLAAVLCVVLACPAWPAYAEGAAGAAQRPNYAGQVQGDERILHALNRFTFGPRMGDLEAVRAQGLDAWFEKQLHPAQIDHAALDARLADYPAMRLPVDELIARFPSNAVIRQVANGKAAMPQQWLLKTVYANQVARTREKREAKAQLSGNGGNAMTANAMGADVIGAHAAPMKKVDSPGTEAAPMQGDMKAAGAANDMTAAPSAQMVDPATVQAVLALPPRDRVLRLAAMPQPELDDFLHGLRGPQREALFADMTPGMKETIGALEAPERTVAGEVLAARMTRDIYSEAQLQEVMTDFWLNHFNVYLRKNETAPYYLESYEQDVIRPRALGHFEDLLEAVAHSPAMLIYLDNAESTGPDSVSSVKARYAAWRNGKGRKNGAGLNENYARELMELHTLGVAGGYTQADVIQAARILTGWTVDRPQRGGGFKFDANRHEPGAKKVMGHKFKEHGEGEGEDLLHFLATRPATAQFVSRKLAVRFVSDDPPKALVDRMAKTFLASKGDMAAVLRTMYRSPEFWGHEVYRAKVKTPLEYVVSAVRAGNPEVKQVRPLIEALRGMGMPLYECIPPTGYKEDAADWVSTGALVTRMNFALSLAANQLNGVRSSWGPAVDAPGSVLGAATGAEAEEARLEQWLVPAGLSENTRAAVLQQFARQNAAGGPTHVAMNAARKPAGASPVEKQDQLLAGLLLGSPEFQRR